MNGLDDKIGHSFEVLMTCDEVADFLRVHVSSVRRWSRSGKLKAYKVGGRGDWRYRQQDVLAFLCSYSAATTNSDTEAEMTRPGELIGIGQA